LVGIISRIQILVGSIVEPDVEAIVNSANTALVMGGGVAAAILAEAGAEVEDEAIAHGPIQVGDVVVTAAGELSALHVLHVAVVGDVPTDVYQCTMNVLERAADLGVSSVAFPALGTGNAGVSVHESAFGMCQAMVDFAEQESSIRDVRIVLWDDEHLGEFEQAL
jgi:O-acetyl-ADP-ribose deacetylase (regulator of RNase III)